MNKYSSNHPFFNHSIILGMITLLMVQCTQKAEQEYILGQEKGTFMVHRRQSKIGKEDYEIIRNEDHLLVRSIQGENERGRISAVIAELRLTDNLEPISYEMIRIANEDTLNILKVSPISDDSIQVVELFKEPVNMASGDYFPVHSSIPPAIEMMLYHYLVKNEKTTIRTLPRGEVTLTFRKKDTINLGGQTQFLDRYIVEGINWGTRTIWLDSANTLVAVVKANTQFRELIRAGYEDAFSLFVKGNVEEQLNVLNGYTDDLRKEQSELKAFIGGDIITGLEDKALLNQTVIVEGKLIKAIGPKSKIAIPENAQTFDMSGKVLMPGLWDMHAHSNQVQWGPAYLAGGVTTIRDLGNELEFVTAFRDAMNSGKCIGPHMLLGGMTDGPGIKGNGVVRARTAEEAEKVVDLYYNNGYQQIKIYNSIEPEILKVLTSKAHEKGMTVTGHVPVAVGNTVQAIKLGMDQFNHRSLFLSILFPDDSVKDLGRFYLADKAVSREAIENAKRILLTNDIVLDPTIALDVLRYMPYATPAETAEPDAYRIAYELFEGKRFFRGVDSERSEMVQKEIKKAMEIIGEFSRAGIPVVAGTDNVVPVFSLYLELETYHKYGNLSTIETIRTATSVPAKAMGMQSVTGTLEVGKEADMAILEQNPLADISNIRTVSGVVNNGIYYESDPLWEAVDFIPSNK